MEFVYISWANIFTLQNFSGRSYKNTNWQAPLPSLLLYFEVRCNNPYCKFMSTSFCFWCDSPPPTPPRARASSFTRFLEHTDDAPQSVGLLWTIDQLVAETSA